MYKNDYDFINEVREDYRQQIKNGLIKSSEKVPFICKYHGEYWQKINNHSNGQGCPICAKERHKMRSMQERRTDYPFMEEIREDWQYKIRNGECNNDTKVVFICKEHGQYEQKLSKHLLGQGCPKCKRAKGARTNKINHAKNYDFIHIIHQEDRIKLLNGDLGQQNKVRFWCDKCNNWFIMSIAKYIQGQRCKCDRVQRIKKAKRRKEYDFINEVREDYRNKIINGEINSYEKVPFICNIHGEYWQSLMQRETKKTNCPKCAYAINSKAQRRTDYPFMNEIREDYRQMVSNQEFNNSTKIPFICKEHGEYWQTLANHMYGTGCKQCKIAKQVKGRNTKHYEFMDEIRHDYQDKIRNGEISVTDKIPFICPAHGEYWQMIGDHKYNGASCPICTISKTPYSFYEWLKSITDNIIINDRQAISPMEIDFYLPEHKIGFEFNDIETHQTLFKGQSTKHRWNNGKTSTYHINKYKACMDKDIRLFQIWDIEWQDERKRSILESIIKHALKMTQYRIHYRKCEIKDINSNEANIFFNENHLQGSAKGNGYIGLYYKGELVSAICYSKQVGGSKADWSISRMATKKNWSVFMGASKLLNEVLKRVKGTVDYFVLNDYFDGNSFKATGWKETGSRPMAIYYDKQNNVLYGRSPSKYQERKQLCLDGKMYRAYTSGTTTYRKVVD